jgi:endonuclease/exonuclease/phosphatase family metal-dependent hydrolase
MGTEQKICDRACIRKNVPAGVTQAPLVIAVLLWIALASSAQPRLPGTFRVATFNVFELSCAKIDAVDSGGERGAHLQLRKAAEVLRRVQPDVLLINEIDYSADANCARRFADRYLASRRDGLAPLDLPHLAYLPVNTGVPSGFDFTNDGDTTDPGDAFGFGAYPGQYGMAIFSRYPFDPKAIRTFQLFLWKDMPGHVMPDGRAGRPAFYSADAIRVFRLSSKSHWDVPVQVEGRVIHFLVSHPTPPVFDGPEDANGRRNFDEIRLWADYISGGATANYIVDDQQRRGGLAAGSSFVVLGDLNAEPFWDPPSYGRTAISQLLEHPALRDPRPLAEGEWPPPPGRTRYPGDPRTRTNSVGRLDYVLPSRDLDIADSGVWYPRHDTPLSALMGPPEPASDHALVWLDIRVDP